MSQRRPETGLNWPSLMVPAGLRQLALALLSQTGPRAGSGGLQIHRRGFEAERIPEEHPIFINCNLIERKQLRANSN